MAIVHEVDLADVVMAAEWEALADIVMGCKWGDMEMEAERKADSI